MRITSSQKTKFQNPKIQIDIYVINPKIQIDIYVINPKIQIDIYMTFHVQR
jgi:hypothetical protein